MKFDWQAFCREYGVEYADSGPKVSRGNINIKCPFCDDGGQHMGLKQDEDEPLWACWRCRAGGRSPVRLLCKLLKVTAPRAHEIIGTHNIVSPDEFERLLVPKGSEAARPAYFLRPPARRTLPQGCKLLDGKHAGARRFLDYLKKRGFWDAEALCDAYQLHYGVGGDQNNRIVYPVYYQGALVAWTGRSVYANAKLRYKADDSGIIKRVVANYDELIEEDKHMLLAISEGPMDFLKLDHYGQDEGMRATCVFGTSYTEQQVAKLVKLCKHFLQSVVVFDPEAFMEGAKLAWQLSELSGRRVLAKMGPADKDPGELTDAEVHDWAWRWRSPA